MFARTMEAVLQKHDAVKGDTWKFCPVDFLEKKLEEETREYIDAPCRVRDPMELVDIANICMMLYNRRKP